MPELPEVETVVRGLRRLIIGATVKLATTDNPKSFPNAPADVADYLIGAQVASIERRAKVLMIHLDSGYTLLVHLKMTGQLVYIGNNQRFGAGHPNDSLIQALPDKSTRVTIEFSDGSKLFFNDQRKFGWMRLLPTVSIPEIDFMKKVGPEPLADDFTSDDFMSRFQRRRRSSIKAALLDQTVIAGVGNIYADEALWGAGIHPSRRVESLSAVDFENLYAELRAVLQTSIDNGGSSDRNYVDAEGKRGSYLKFARVFRREGQACTRCGAIIEKSRVAGRGTHTCPHCQPSDIIE